MDKNKLFEFLTSHKIAVISTFGEAAPESAVVDYSITKDFHIIFNTYLGSRKYKNIMINRHVAFVIGWDNLKTIQYEGEALEISEDSLKNVLEEHSHRFEYIRLWKTQEMRYFRVKPTWIRYTDYNLDPPESLELVY